MDGLSTAFRPQFDGQSGSMQAIEGSGLDELLQPG